MQFSRRKTVFLKRKNKIKLILKELHKTRENAFTIFASQAGAGGPT